MSISPVSPYGNSRYQTADVVTFVVDNKELQIESRYLGSCDYFHTMLSSGLCESHSKRIAIECASYETVGHFLLFLKTYQFPKLTPQQQCELYYLAHAYQHQPLLEQIRPKMENLISSNLCDILILAHHYSDDFLMEKCKNRAANRYSSNSDLISELITQKAGKVIEEIFKWPVNVLTGLINCNLQANTRVNNFYYGLHHPSRFKQFSCYQHNTNNIIVALIDHDMEETAANILCYCQSKNYETEELISNSSNALYRKVSTQQTPPSKAQNDLISALIKIESFDKIEYQTSKNNYDDYDRDDPYEPTTLLSMFINSCIYQGWSETFETIINASNGIEAQINCNLLDSIIHNKRVSILETLVSQKSLKLNQKELSKYTSLSIDTRVPQIIKLVLSLKGKDSKLDYPCMRSALSKGNEIFKIVYPHAHPNAITKLREEAFNNNRFDLAEFFFPKSFDSSNTNRPSSGIPWFHEVAMKGDVNWIKFIGSRASNKNKEVSLDYEGRKGNRTPLLLALEMEIDIEKIELLFEMGCKADKRATPWIFSYNDSDLLKAFLKNSSNCVESIGKENFFHLYFKSEKPLLSLRELSELLDTVNRSILNQQDEKGNTPLHLAIQTNRLEEALLLFQKNSAVLSKTNKQGETPLKSSKGKGFEKNLLFFIDKASSSTFSEYAQKQLLLWCAENYLYPHCMKLIPLIKDLKSVQTPDGSNLLHLSCKAGAFRAALRLLDLNSIPVNMANKQGQTPLHLAVISKDKKIIQLLLEKEGDPNQLDHQGNTPLSLALTAYQADRSQEMRNIIDILENKSCLVQ